MMYNCVLHKTDFHEILSDYPELVMQFKKNIEEKKAKDLKRKEEEEKKAKEAKKKEEKDEEEKSLFEKSRLEGEGKEKEILKKNTDKFATNLSLSSGSKSRMLNAGIRTNPLLKNSVESETNTLNFSKFGKNVRKSLLNDSNSKNTGVGKSRVSILEQQKEIPKADSTSQN
ncbi:hypothetical protein HMI56_001802 [Coelomomyces lativittatus]|nr:hypothetical protein HMI56_001802 [Coelomomyces lativittatus]